MRVTGCVEKIEGGVGRGGGAVRFGGEVDGVEVVLTDLEGAK